LLIKEIFDRGKGKWGWRTIQMKLKDEYGIVMNHKKIKRIKSKYDLTTEVRRRNPYKQVLKKTKEHRYFPNILNRQFQQFKPGTTFCTDITFLPFGKQTAYLSAVKDIASREIISWNMSLNLQMELVLSTLDKLKECLTEKQILLHSDQGFHYTSPDFIHRAKALNLIQSMSRKGNCTDNAPMESFFGHFKDEVEYKNCQSFQELKQLTNSYINYYNNKRRQWNLHKMTPVEYKQYLLAKSG
jgi:putative transposase